MLTEWQWLPVSVAYPGPPLRLLSPPSHAYNRLLRDPPPPFHHIPISYPFPTTNMAAKSDGAPISLRNETQPDCSSRSDLRPPQRRLNEQRYTLQDCCWTLCALLVFFSDGASDLWLAADYYLRRQYWCFSLTLVFVIVPSLVVQVLSFRWFAYDFSETIESGTAAAAVVAATGAEESDFSTKDSGERGAGRAVAAGVLPGPGTGGGARSCCRAFMWFFQTIIHIFQLAQVWRWVCRVFVISQEGGLRTFFAFVCIIGCTRKFPSIIPCGYETISLYPKRQNIL